jgi:hypothetical protein
MWFAFLVGQGDFGGALRRRAAAARFAKHADELLAPLELLQGRMLRAVQLHVEQLLGARIGQHDLAELIDRQHRVGEAREDFAQLVALDRDAADADVGSRADHFQLFGPPGELSQPLANPLAHLPPEMVPFADGNRLEYFVIAQGVWFQVAQAVDEPPRRFGRFGRLQQRDAGGEQRQAHSGQEHGQPARPTRRRKRRLHDPGQAQGRADHRHSSGGQELHDSSLNHRNGSHSERYHGQHAAHVRAFRAAGVCIALAPARGIGSIPITANLGQARGMQGWTSWRPAAKLTPSAEKCLAPSAPTAYPA